MVAMVVIAGLLAALWERSLFFNCSRVQTQKPCSPNSYHAMRIISTRRTTHREDSAIPDMPELGRLFVRWDEVREQERCTTCGHTRTIVRRENFRQQHKPPPT